MPGRIVRYGATGYIGGLTAQAMLASGARPVLADRDQAQHASRPALTGRRRGQPETAIAETKSPKPLRHRRSELAASWTASASLGGTGTGPRRSESAADHREQR